MRPMGAIGEGEGCSHGLDGSGLNHGQIALKSIFHWDRLYVGVCKPCPGASTSANEQRGRPVCESGYIPPIAVHKGDHVGSLLAQLVGFISHSVPEIEHRGGREATLRAGFYMYRRNLNKVF